jgi:hypothetical protein
MSLYHLNWLSTRFPDQKFVRFPHLDIYPGTWYLADHTNQTIYLDYFVNSPYDYDPFILPAFDRFGEPSRLPYVNSSGDILSVPCYKSCANTPIIDCSKIVDFELIPPQPLPYFVLGGATNFYHWHFDVLPRLMNLCETIDDSPILISDEFSIRPGSFQEKSLQLLGFDVSNIVILKSSVHYRIPNCFVSNVRSDHNWGASDGSHIDSLLCLRNCLLDALSKLHSNNANHWKGANIFISRSDSTDYRLHNPSLIERKMLDNGFRSITMSSLPYIDQLKLFSNASSIISPHGAALSLSIVINDSCLIAEIFDDENSFRSFFPYVRWWWKFLLNTGIGSYRQIDISTDLGVSSLFSDPLNN